MTSKKRIIYQTSTIFKKVNAKAKEDYINRKKFRKKETKNKKRSSTLLGIKSVGISKDHSIKRNYSFNDMQKPFVREQIKRSQKSYK